MGAAVTVIIFFIMTVGFAISMVVNLKSKKPNPHYVKLYQFLNKERVERKLKPQK